MERKEKSQTLETGNSFLEQVQPQHADRPAESLTGAPASYADDLVFDPESLVLGRLSVDSATKNSVSIKTAPSAYQLSIPEPLRKALKTTLFACLGGLLAAVAICAVSLWYQGSYSVEAKVLFLGGDHKAKGVATWAIGDELRALTCSEVAASAAKDVFLAFPDAWGSGNEVRVRQATWVAGNETGSAPAMSAAQEARGLELWLTHELSVEPVESNGATGFMLKMKGPEPDLLKSALNAYIRRYLEYRSTLASISSAQLRQAAAESESTSDTDEASSPDSQLKKIELLTRSFELALQSMDTGKGTFKGFIPDVSVAATPSLARFQDKLLELEIKKRGLAVQFTQNSKEIRSIDQEIRGVKAAMRECLSEYVEFLKQGKKGLISQKAGEEKRKSSKAAPENQSNRQCSGHLPNGDGWFRTREGLYVFTSSPCVVSQPPLARVSQCARSFLNWTSGRPATPTVGTFADDTSVSSAKFASADQTIAGREDYGHRLASGESFSKDGMKIQQEHVR
jgi:hypothetical protein